MYKWYKKLKTQKRERVAERERMAQILRDRRPVRMSFSHPGNSSTSTMSTSSTSSSSTSSSSTSSTTTSLPPRKEKKNGRV